ncbi:MAG: hypothetical protein LBR26_06765 [Prevotella sp.]|jgi:hypothetical protein|nr:hypothetical protein [Prevotella sp.]
MSIFGYLILIFIVYRVVSKFIKQDGEQGSNGSNGSNGFKWADFYSQRLRSVLNTCQGFDNDGIIDSAAGFYLFSYDSTAREFVFIEDDEVIHRFSYRDLIEYKVRETKDHKIIIDLETSFPDKAYISIECFEKEKLLKKMPQLQYRLHEIDGLHELERDKADRIEDILAEITEENKEAPDVLLPPPYKDYGNVEVIKPAIPALPAVENIITAVREKKEGAPVENEKQVEVMQETCEAPEAIPETIREMPEAVSEEKPMKIHESGKEKPLANGKIPVSLSEIEDYSRGKFIEYEVRSAVGDAKMKGQKYIYLTNEQLDRLKS